ncbi:MAG: DUF2782 domain-containing protein [Ferrovum sp.]|nr:DUF2782 domain-containing protein [Ferrovum sp.]NDU86878.1 DUF2782 domain-containing protein [Ferrovum sp.]
MNARYPFYLTLALALCTLRAQSEPLPGLTDAPPPPTVQEEGPSSSATAPANAHTPPPQATTEAPPATDDNAEVTIVEKQETRFEEYRINGRLYKIKVTPKIGPPYYLIDEEGHGLWHRHDALDNNFQPPRWVILKF